MKPKREISSAMQRALVARLTGNAEGESVATLEALRWRGLVDDHASLTQDGRVAAIASLPLRRQCEVLGLPLLEAAVPDISEPEPALFRELVQDGYCGAYCEGGAVLVLLRAACLDLLAQLNTFGSRADACSRFTEAQFTIHQSRASDILSCIEAAQPSSVARHAEEICATNTVQEAYRELSPGAVVALFDALGAARLRRIAEWFFTDPYGFRSGWPDLTLVRGDQLRLVEVKTTDRLHGSQIRTIPKVLSVLPGCVSVVRLSKGPAAAVPTL